MVPVPRLADHRLAAEAVDVSLPGRGRMGGGIHPILRTWMNAFPGIIKPKSEIPAALMPHLRYPPDLFEVQRQILTQYHVLSAQSFYGGQNFWAVPDEPSNSSGSRMRLTDPA